MRWRVLLCQSSSSMIRTFTFKVNLDKIKQFQDKTNKITWTWDWCRRFYFRRLKKRKCNLMLLRSRKSIQLHFFFFLSQMWCSSVRDVSPPPFMLMFIIKRKNLLTKVYSSKADPFWKGVLSPESKQKVTKGMPLRKKQMAKYLPGVSIVHKKCPDRTPRCLEK